VSKPPIADFDSASAMLKASAAFLHGRDFPAIGQSQWLEGIVPVVNQLPRRGREWVYIAGGWMESLAQRSVPNVETESIYQWAADLYPQRQYPCVFIGSSNGALVNLCAALGAPWLPQTLFMPVSQTRVHPDEPTDGLEDLKETGERFLAANPDVQLHHMHDPNQDRMMLELMTYFRIKRRRLGPAYESFLDEALEPGGTIVVVECGESWPVTKVSDRYYFQFGAIGGMPPSEFFEGSERVEEYLARYGSYRRDWEPPAPNTEAPEAEWGFEPALLADIERYAGERGLKIVRLRFAETMDFPPFVAELYRWWYRRRGLPTNRLMAQSFLLVEPYRTLQAGLIPYWFTFATEPMAEGFERYLAEAEPYDEIRMMLFSHGTEGVGLAPIERWRELLGHARREGSFLGVDEELFPLDFATFGNYHRALRALPSRYPVDVRLTLDEVERFAADNRGRFAVEWGDARLS
jgi:hypothetical protein